MCQPNQAKEQESSPLDCFHLMKKLNSTKYPVYLASDLRHDRQIAIKFFPVKVNVSINYRKESDFFSQFNHPHIVKMYESVDQIPSNCGCRDHELVSYLNLEFASFGDLFEIIARSGPMSEALARSLFAQFLDALSYMHSKNVAHLDLKVENLLIDENYNLKLTDFDLSQPIDDTFLEGRGTPGYRAPEVKEGTGKNFTASDIYSAGVILFILISGIPPYTEVDKGMTTEFDPFYKIMRKCNDKFWEVHAKHKQNPEFYSKTLISLINWMLAEEPSDRPTIDQIINHAWFQDEIWINEKYAEEMKNFITKNLPL
jgi:serine/threonine protein kinase